jgi:ABC-2 type transport system ATP-binding protein
MSWAISAARHLRAGRAKRTLPGMISTDTQSEGLAVCVRNLRKSYGEIEAVGGISFEVPRGEVFCLLGPNGAGKTTTVEILEGYRTPDGGDVRVLGMVPSDSQRELRERVGIVLQHCGVQRDLTVAELIEMYGRYHLLRRRVDDVLELVELTQKRDVQAKRLSGGQRRRLDLALALVGDPDLIFLDEPTTGFDPAARRQAWSTIRSMCELGKTVFLTTHYMDEAEHLADRVAVMRAGEVIALGTPDELGGRDVRPAEIRFTLPPAWSLGDIPQVPALSRSLEADRVLLRSAEPVLATQLITSWAIERDISLGQFSVSQPTLEDIYLELTGPGSTDHNPVREEVVR